MPQQYLGYETPAAVAGRNVQDEFNLHNLDLLYGGNSLDKGCTSGSG